MLWFVGVIYFEVSRECHVEVISIFFSTIKNGLENSKYPLSHWFLCTTRKPMFGTEGRNRTGTKLPSPDFESGKVKNTQQEITNNNI